MIRHDDAAYIVLSIGNRAAQHLNGIVCCLVIEVQRGAIIQFCPTGAQSRICARGQPGLRTVNSDVTSLIVISVDFHFAGYLEFNIALQERGNRATGSIQRCVINHSAQLRVIATQVDDGPYRNFPAFITDSLSNNMNTLVCIQRAGSHLHRRKPDITSIILAGLGQGAHRYLLSGSVEDVRRPGIAGHCFSIHGSRSHSCQYCCEELLR